MTAMHAILALSVVIAVTGSLAAAATVREWWRMERENRRVSRRYALGPDRRD